MKKLKIFWYSLLSRLGIEIWKDIPNYEGLYQVSNLGRVKSLKRTIMRSNNKPHPVKERILKLIVDDSGYPSVNLYKKGKMSPTSIHQLVMLTFEGECSQGKEINHKNGIKQDNRWKNLEYITHKENIHHAIKNDLFNNNLNNLIRYNNSQKIKVFQYDKQNNFIAKYNSLHDAERETKIPSSNIHHCLSSKRKTAGGFIWVKEG